METQESGITWKVALTHNARSEWGQNVEKNTMVKGIN